MSLLALLILNLTLPPAAVGNPSVDIKGPTFEGRTFEEWKQIITPGPEELWLSIPWHTSLHQGLQKSAEEGKPLLLWLMNGHPLGCT